MTLRLAFIALVTAATVSTSAAQSNLHSIFVRVVDADTGRPIPRVRVTVSVIEGTTMRGALEFTDRQGRAWLRRLPSGRARLRVLHEVFYDIAAPPGAIPPGVSVQLDDGKPPPLVTFRLARGGTISGQVFDEFGEPMAELRVGLFRQSALDGAPTSTGRSAITDDRGEYRVAGLPPGKYIIGATPTYSPRPLGEFPADVLTTAQWINVLQGWSNDVESAAGSAPPLPAPVAHTPLVGYAATFYPGDDRAHAQAVDVEGGREYAGISFTMRTTPMAFVTGTVTGMPAGLPGGLSVALVPDAPGGATHPIPATTIDIHGRFSMPFVPHGSYTLLASLKRQAGQDAYSARVPVSVGSETAAMPLVVILERTFR
ncbi:MAG TPA: carboxypeptidase-like regulatory domain-containing protein [Vicinamibacterales bacterium]|nr:carboxypeptidase-like regulatory domain-containing protein [Vicinamibacterales bacterium]